MHTLDAMTPPLVLAVMMAIARSRAGDPGLVAAVIVGGCLLLALGTAAAFFRDMSASHIMWPAMLGIAAVFLPLIALHMQLERAARGAPVPVHLLTLAFTWTAILVATCAACGLIVATVAATPQWAGVAVSPIALLIGWLPALATRATPDPLYSAALAVAAVSLIAVGIAWLLPEWRRWFVTPVALGVGAATIWQAGGYTRDASPGKWLPLVDVALAVIAAGIALAAPLLCRWLRAYHRPARG